MSRTAHARPPRNSPARQQRLVDDWNARYQVRQLVRYWPGLREGAGFESRTRTAAQMVGGCAVVWLDDASGCIALSHVKAVRA